MATVFPLCATNLDNIPANFKQNATINNSTLESYSQSGWAVVDQTVQHGQQVVFPVQISKPLLHNTGKRLVLELLQWEDELTLKRRNVEKLFLKKKLNKTVNYFYYILFFFFFTLEVNGANYFWILPQD